MSNTLKIMLPIFLSGIYFSIAFNLETSTVKWWGFTVAWSIIVAAWIQFCDYRDTKKQKKLT